MIGILKPIGENWPTILYFGGGLLGVYLLLAVLIMGIEAIRRFIR